MTEASWTLASVTIVLVIITIWYAIETRRIVKRMDMEREESYRPVITFQLIPWQPNLLKLRIQNIGNGPAFDVKGSIKTFTNSGQIPIPWSYPLLGKDKYEEFGFAIQSDDGIKTIYKLDEIRSNVIETQVELVYTSIHGKQYKLEESIKVQEVTNDWIASKMMATQDHPDRLLPRIAKTLEEISNKIRNY